MANPGLANLYLIQRINGAYSEVPADQVGLAVGKSGTLNFSFENFTVKTEVSGIGSIVLGGASNSSLRSFGVLVGGIYNRTSGEYASIGGGQVNYNLTTGSTIFGGVLSKIDDFRLDPFNQGPYGPKYKYADNTASTMLNPETSFMTSKAGIIGGGAQHDIMGNFGVIAGGCKNCVGQPGQEYYGGPSFSTILGGAENRVGLYFGSDIDGCGGTNIGSYNGLGSILGVVLGHNNNSYGGYGNVFFGLGNSAGFYDKQVSNSTLIGRNGIILGTGSTVAGGEGNKAMTQILYSCYPVSYSTVLGGLSNSAGEDYSLVFGGQDNCAWSRFSYVGGGSLNRISSDHSGAAMITQNDYDIKNSVGPNTLSISFKSGIYFKNSLFFNRINPISSSNSVIRASGVFV